MLSTIHVIYLSCEINITFHHISRPWPRRCSAFAAHLVVAAHLTHLTHLAHSAHLAHLAGLGDAHRYSAMLTSHNEQAIHGRKATPSHYRMGTYENLAHTNGYCSTGPYINLP
jgi:hypothetical protein